MLSSDSCDGFVVSVSRLFFVVHDRHTCSFRPRVVPSIGKKVLRGLEIEFSLEYIFSSLLDAVLQQHLLHVFGRYSIFPGKAIRNIQYILGLEIRKFPESHFGEKLPFAYTCIDQEGICHEMKKTIWLQGFKD